MIEELRRRFNENYRPGAYGALLERLDRECGTHVKFRVAETPVFLPAELIQQMALSGQQLADSIMASPEELAAARAAIPPGYRVAGETPRPHFLTADFALIRGADGSLEPRLVEIQAFPSVFGFQAVLCNQYQAAYGLPAELECFSGGMSEQAYWALLRQTIVGEHDPATVVLADVDPEHQKTRPDFEVTAKRLGIAVADIAAVEAVGEQLHYRNKSGKLTPIRRIYNRAIADELIARRIELKFDLERRWDVEWAGHPNWYFLISKISIPALAEKFAVVPPAVFVDEFLDGAGRAKLAGAGVELPDAGDGSAACSELLLKPLFSFAGKGIEFEPTQERLEAIPREERRNYLLQQRMRFEPTIETPFGLTQAEIRILYAWPDGGRLTPAMSLVRLGRGKMMGVDHNRDLEWVGASAAFVAR